MKLPNYDVIQHVPGKPIVIKDLGPWDKFPTVTNAAEEVIEDLGRRGMLMNGSKVFYIDSEGRMDELLIRDGKFAGFSPGIQQVKRYYPIICGCTDDPHAAMVECEGDGYVKLDDYNALLKRLGLC